MAESHPPETSVPEDVSSLPLDGWHRSTGARMVPFAGYWMPIQYQGIIAEHEWTRTRAGLFDVSHMGQVVVAGEGAGRALERLLPADLSALKPGRLRYSLLLAEDGGILDDLMVTNMSGEGGEDFRLVVNGAVKQEDFTHLRAGLPPGLRVEMLEDRALVALQGPEAGAALDALLPGIDGAISFMQACSREWNGALLEISRSGYTGEDGFEISIPAASAEAFATALTGDERVRPIGLGARDSLRLEAGLPLYGHDIDRSTDPVSAGLGFALSRRRRESGDFPGAAPIAAILESGPAQMRVGLALEGRLPAREGSDVYLGAAKVGRVTSGGFSPSLGHPVAMAYVDARLAAPGTQLEVEVRGRRLPGKVVPTPFVPHRYRRQGSSK